MVVKTHEVFTWLPRAIDTNVNVEINGTNETAKIVESSFIKPVTIGIGRFTLKMGNVGGVKTDVYSEGQNVKFYADNTDASTLQFWGIIDKIKGDMTKRGNFLEMEGRHRSYPVTETLVCHSASSVECSQLLKDLISKFLSGKGFTSTNVEATSPSKSMTVTWNYKPFWECVQEICEYAGHDCYVDDDLDFHFFAENSNINEEDAVVEGHTFREIVEWGADKYNEKTRVTAMGEMSDGETPIIYTAISTGEGDTVKEIFVKDTSANTATQVQSIAEARLDQVTNVPTQGKVLSFGLEYTNPGDNIWYAIERQNIFDLYKVLVIKHLFGSRYGGWRTETTVEREVRGMSNVLEDALKRSTKIQFADNPNKHLYSYNFEFDDQTNIATLTNAKVEDGWLKMTASPATITTSAQEADSNITYAELRYVGVDVGVSTFEVSADDGLNYQTLTKNTLTAINNPGTNLKIKITLTSDTDNPYPKIESMAVLFS